jgi:large subunit ribosomal protein L25
MARTEFQLEPRTVSGKKVAQLRRAGFLPANIYGRGLESVSVQASIADFTSVIHKTGANEVIDLKVSGEKAARPAVIHRIQRHPVNGHLLHAEFYQVSLREKMRADVPIVLTGTSDAVETYKGVLLQELAALHVEALPLDLPSSVEVDVSAITELEGSIHVSALVLPGNVSVLTDPAVAVVRVASPRVAEEEEAPAAAEEEAAEAAGEAPAAESSEGESN